MDSQANVDWLDAKLVIVVQIEDTNCSEIGISTIDNRSVI